MVNIHVLPDEKLGGVLREFVEVDRPVKKGDFIVVYENRYFYEDITVDKPYLVHDASIEYIKFYDDVGDERMWNTSRKDFAIIEPTDIVHIYGTRYRLVDRKAKVGDKIIIVKNLEYRNWFKIGEIAIVEEVDSNGNVFADFNENKRVYDDGKWCVGRNYYYVLEPLHTCENCSVDCAKADDELPKTTDNMLSVDESAIDLLANLTQRVTKLERENKELRHQSHNHRLDIEQIYIDVKSLRENVDVLDERTQPLLALIKAVKEGIEMSKIHVLPDEKLNGVLREYIEVERKANAGEKIIGKNTGNIYTVLCTFSNSIETDSGKHIHQQDYFVLEPTDIVRIDGKRYRMVDREAKVGERIIIVNGYGWYRDKVGDIYDVIHPSKYDFEGNDNSKAYVEYEKNAYNDVIHFVRRGNYRVLEPVEPIKLVTVENKNGKSLNDLLSNLAHRLTQLEEDFKQFKDITVDKFDLINKLE